ncbi:MAG: tRNA preQ1(34) S-adenosylmethionine ribosyltransferase-isomerase QueA [Candidatus Cloacimonadaceae bacterium]|jgi:S-adenosylmethionine:tRNA ribosyltransferase-isomerase|nr:tRNA preQ1(34) S-adenosylmethionine ribosyltransferase-isomerase QueA [Candidatus Cloacimonadota bacterium]MDX9949848.1 tRNA preQ1(34) S-adenosylmethionine ribosyltransferase-isomerase QueA [Candidatus Syntrophosphaera sp.]
MNRPLDPPDQESGVAGGGANWNAGWEKELGSYDYDLPQELIAQYPLSKRDSSRLMHLDRQAGAFYHRSFGDIVDLISRGEVLVLNSSKVIPARLFGFKENGTKVELLLLRNLGQTRWQCLVHPGRRLKKEQWLQFSPGLKGWISLGAEDGSREVTFESQGDYWQEIEKVGHVPLPPYIKREDEIKDRHTYQTVYAREPGSVAAPTAGLHFSPEILEALRAKGVLLVELVLHVGMGTFLPVKTERIDEHKMHSEFCTVDENAAQIINLAKTEGRRIIAVGSTSMRSLESFWNGKSLDAGSKWTDIFIYPGKQIHVADALITNFHLPKSTLIMMIAAFAGLDLVKKAYEAAIAEKYRFFSYGDAMYIS